MMIYIPEEIEPREVDQDFVDQLMEYMKDPLPPKYVSLGGTSMVLRGRVYWRPAGAWEARWVWIDGVLTCHFPSMPHLHGLPFEEITEEEFMSDNQGYV
jgi:hypothetical protein